MIFDLNEYICCAPNLILNENKPTSSKVNNW